MDGGVVGSLIGVGGAVVLAAGGGGLRLWSRSISRRDQRIEVMQATIDAQERTIAQLERQVDRLQVTADIQERFFSELPEAPRRRIDPRRPA